MGFDVFQDKCINSKCTVWTCPMLSKAELYKWNSDLTAREVVHLHPSCTYSNYLLNLTEIIQFELLELNLLCLSPLQAMFLHQLQVAYLQNQVSYERKQVFLFCGRYASKNRPICLFPKTI